MKALCLTIAAIVLTCACAAAQTEDQCAYDLGAMMQLEYSAFDSTPGAGWRVIGETPGCLSRR